eukprot:12776775-Alexandrium_andersonii.AAC.1
MVGKAGTHSTDPMAHRGLLLLPVIYRSWAKCRMRELRDWMDAWRCPGIYSAFGGVGAEDAWMETAVA